MLLLEKVRLFTKFFRIDNEETRAAGETGLGLSITKGIVEAHGGSIGLYSQLGQGTRFSVTIPTGMPTQPDVVPVHVAARSLTAMKSHFKMPATQRAEKPGAQVANLA